MKTYIYELTTRHYELDINRHINNTNYYRYLEEARVVMMKEMNFDISEVYTSNADMIIYKYVVLFKQQVLYGEELVIESTQINTRKLRGILRQNIYRKKDKILVFSADAYWAYAPKNEKGKSEAVEFASRFGKDVNSEIEPLEDHSLQKSAEIGNKTHLILLESRPYEMDSFQHMNNAVYPAYYEVARWSFFRDLFDWKLFREQGTMIVLYRSTIEFIKPVLPFEKITIKTRLSELTKTRYAFVQEMYGADNLIRSRAYSGSCIVGPKGIPIKIPPIIYNHLMDEFVK
ncbi:MAG: acyl-CoA thioesterase [Leptospiraceae bacterium]|nr:acyl-CoA thioesterase [Leptospiraceae bacterium]